MTESIVFISRNRLKPGMLESFRQHYQTSLPMVEANKPGTLVQLAYFHEDSGEISIVRVFSDQEGMDAQLMGSDQRSRAAYAFIEPFAMEIYGKPSEYSLAMIQKVAGADISVRLFPMQLGGFIRRAEDSHG